MPYLFLHKVIHMNEARLGKLFYVKWFDMRCLNIIRLFTYFFEVHISLEASSFSAPELLPNIALRNAAYTKVFFLVLGYCLLQNIIRLVCNDMTKTIISLLHMNILCLFYLMRISVCYWRVDDNWVFWQVGQKNVSPKALVTPFQPSFSGRHGVTHLSSTPRPHSCYFFILFYFIFLTSICLLCLFRYDWFEITCTQLYVFCK